MTPDQLANLSDSLASWYTLSETEGEDLLAFGATLAMGECEVDTILIHMEMRAEVLHLVGSDMEEWINEFKRIYGG